MLFPNRSRESTMKMSTKGRYGLRVMVELAFHYGRGPLLVETIARNQGISGKYIHVLVTSLRAAGLVRAVRGPNGGYELTRNPSRVTALEVVSALEGKNAPAECVSDASVCSRADQCAARDVWCEVASAIDGVLSGFTLEQLSLKQSTKHQEAATYHI
jgi:Rrf2 family transcriptional regulator, cysteine metabolism repressor